MLELPFGITPTNPVYVDAYRGPYADVAEALSTVPQAVRVLGQVVFVQGLGEYWWKDGVTDSDLIEKTSGSSDVYYVTTEAEFIAAIGAASTNGVNKRIYSKPLTLTQSSYTFNGPGAVDIIVDEFYTDGLTFSQDVNLICNTSVTVSKVAFSSGPPGNTQLIEVTGAFPSFVVGIINLYNNVQKTSGSPILAEILNAGSYTNVGFGGTGTLIQEDYWKNTNRLRVDDSNINTVNTWSSNKISSELGAITVTTGNGIEDIGSGTIGLGGTLTQDTTIDLDSNEFNLVNLELLNIVSPTGAGISIEESYDTLRFGTGDGNGLSIEGGTTKFISLATGDGSRVDLGESQAVLALSGDQVSVNLDSTGARILDNINNNYVLIDGDGIKLTDFSNNILILDANGIRLVDSINNVFIRTNAGGLLLEGDYTSGLTANNLITKAYLESQLGSSTYTITDITADLTIPNDTNNVTFNLDATSNKNMTITTTSFTNVGDACEFTKEGDGFPIIVAGSGVVFLDGDSDNIATELYRNKGLRRMKDNGGNVVINLY